MMQKVQRFGGAMMIPVLLFAFSGIMVGLGILFTNQSIFGAIADPSGLWYQCWNVLLQGGWTLFNQVPLLFVIGLPIGLAKKQQARCCMEALVLYLTFHYFLNTMLAQWGGFFGVDLETSSGITNIAGIQTLDMGMMGALLISGIVIWLHNRFFDVELPEWLGTFRGSVFVFAIGYFALIPVAFLCALIWPKIQMGMISFQGFVSGAGALGVWVFIFLERALIPFGLHHLLYVPFFYDSALVQGGVIAKWAQDLPQIAASTKPLIECAPYAWPTLTGLSKVFGCAGITLAFYATAKDEKKKKVLGLIIPIGVTAVSCGITEPIEFTFLFVAPLLFIVHAVLAATLSTIVYSMGIVGVLSDGLISMSALNFIPLMSSHWAEYLKLFAVGLIFTAIYFFVFKFLILKFDFKTPGREDDAEEVTMHSKQEYRERKAAAKEKDNDGISFEELILEGLGGKDNIADVTNCATRLRVNVKDETLCKNDAYFKSIGAHGCSVNGKSIQVIVGLKVQSVREDFEQLL
ncbi:MAG: alpha-glucoside-specific PTS transporter subunit IIBC [Lachnospiraceae bacterium]|nr:alpha-glucoside-specific PTS transporter subunit IIBC [Lachnospiraceae bacterium]